MTKVIPCVLVTVVAIVGAASSLHDAVRSGDLPAVRALAASDAVREAADADGVTPLLAAAIAGRADSAAALLEAGANPNLAASVRTEALIAIGAEMPPGGRLSVAPLHLAAYRGDGSLVRLLLDRAVDVNGVAEDGSGALLLATRQGHQAIVEMLLDAGADPTLANALGVTPLVAAIEAGDLGILRRLVAAGAPLDAGTSEDGLPPLMFAAAEGSEEIVAILLELGARADASAVVSSDALAALGADVDGGRAIEITPLFVAALRGEPAIAERLRRHGADVAFVNAHGLSALLVAAFDGNSSMVAWLLRHGADVNQVPPRMPTPLLAAVEQAHVAMIVLLLEGGADPNLADERGLTPLRAATEMGNAEVVATLKRFGATADTAEDRLLGRALVDTVGFDPLRPAADDGLPQLRILGIAADGPGGHLYWTEYAGNRIRRVRPGAAAIETVVGREAEGPIGVALSADGARLYWTSDHAYPRRVRELELARGTVSTITEGAPVNRPRAIVAAATGLYWSEAISGRLRHVRAVGEPVDDLLTSGISSTGDRPDFRPLRILGLAVPAEGDHLYWSDVVAGAIETARADASFRRTLYRRGENVDFPVGLALDPTSGLLYWADAAIEAIVRAPIGGGRPEIVVGRSAGLIEPRALAIDPSGRKLYWADASRDVIGRFGLDDGMLDELRVGGDETRGFGPRTAPTECAAATREAARSALLRAIKRVSVCLEMVDAVKAVKRRHDDERLTLATCSQQLSGLDPAAPGSFERSLAAVAETVCGDAALVTAEIAAGCGVETTECADTACTIEACRRRAFAVVAQRHPRASEWLGDLRPFLVGAAAARPGGQRGELTRRAVIALDAVLESVSLARSQGIASRLPATGMTTSYRAHRLGEPAPAPVFDDAAMRVGLPLRFIDHGDGTITDASTGLMWEKKCSGCGGLHDFGSDFRWRGVGGHPTIWDWLDAVNAEGGSGFAGYDDWRIPNVKELQSIVDYERFNPAVTRDFHGDLCGLGCADLRDPGCNCTQMSAYWSSTSFADAGDRAFAVLFHLGLVGDRGKEEHGFVRAVRGGVVRESVSAAD